MFSFAVTGFAALLLIEKESQETVTRFHGLAT